MTQLKQFEAITIPKNQFENTGIFLETNHTLLSIRVSSKGELRIQSLGHGAIEIEDNDGRYHTKKVIIK